MVKEYLAKIIAKDAQGLQLISAYCFGAKTRSDQIKFLKGNSIFAKEYAAGMLVIKTPKTVILLIIRLFNVYL